MWKLCARGGIAPPKNPVHWWCRRPWARRGASEIEQVRLCGRCVSDANASLSETRLKLFLDFTAQLARAVSYIRFRLTFTASPRERCTRPRLRPRRRGSAAAPARRRARRCGAARALRRPPLLAAMLLRRVASADALRATTGSCPDLRWKLRLCAESWGRGTKRDKQLFFLSLLPSKTFCFPFVLFRTRSTSLTSLFRRFKSSLFFETRFS